MLDLEDGAGAIHRIWTQRIGGQPSTGWPTMLVLDGNRGFPLACSAAERMSLVPSLLIVGIGYPCEDRQSIVQRRYRDLTSKAPPERIPMRDPTLRIETGGCEAYLRFLMETVLPAIDRRHQRGPTTLFGHSLGGFFAIRALLSCKFPATRYFAADPSVWWNGHELMGLAHGFRMRAPLARADSAKRLAILTAGTAADRQSLSVEEKRNLAAIRGGPNGLDLQLALAGDPRLAVTAEVLPEETHGSILVPALEAAIPFAAGE